MRNGVRHLLGAGAGLLATPLIATGFIVGIERYRHTAAMTVDWVVPAAYVGTVVLIGILAGSRISPLASLLPGLAFLGFIGAAPSLFPSRWRAARTDPPPPPPREAPEPPPLPKRIPSSHR
ncbi:hypothetical protein [Nonomuraea sp. NPDC049625]|uniref:hypothetical protein n=1 Tax=Nonomuraea sp. NPDC049625 TaxID=3155775 RepID=UPI003448BAF5